MIIIALLIGFGLYMIFTSTKERTGCGCLGAIVAVFLFILILAAALLH
jgi:hypothetical protein